MILYIFKILAYSAILLVGYNVFLKRTKHFKSRRLALLFLPLISLLTPFAKNMFVMQSRGFSDILYLSEVNISSLKEISTEVSAIATTNYTSYFVSFYLYWEMRDE